MPKERTASRNAKDKDEEGGWKPWVRDIAIALIIMAVILGGVYAYTGVWPPLVVVESASMQHSSTESFIGVIDTGDLVFVQTAPTRADVVTYLQGRATGYSTYGDYGDVIIFRIASQPQATPIIHRAIMYVKQNGTYADVPDLALLPSSEYQGYRGSVAVPGAFGLTNVTVRQMGFNHNLVINFPVEDFIQTFHRAGYITMGDHNAPSFDRPDQWFPAQGDIIGHARGEIPWFGLIKLLLSPAPYCCQGWGDPHAAASSWNGLALSIVFLIALPFILEAAGWAWGKYAWPRIKPHLPRWRKPAETRPPPEDLEDEDTGDEPREGSSGP